MVFGIGWVGVIIIAECFAIGVLLVKLTDQSQKSHWAAGWNAAVEEMERRAAKPRTIFSSWRT